MPPKKNINMKEEDSTIKKRGRPPKTKSSSKHNKLKDYNDDINDDKKEEELVLHLPNFDDNLTEKKIYLL